MKIRQEYDILVGSGELSEMYPELSGKWSKDEKLFTQICIQNQLAIREIDLDYDEYE